MQTRDTLSRPMSSPVPPAWPGALWIGLLDTPPSGDRLALAEADGYTRARLLVREHGLVRGFAELAVVDGSVDAADLRARIAQLPGPVAPPAEAPLERVTVVIGTRDRPDQLVDALGSVLLLDHPDFEVVVVDNASRTDETRQVVERLAATSPVPLRCVREPEPGLANARNCGIRAAEGELVAFTDDDVIVDPLWLRRLADGFARRPDVALVTGLVPSGEVRTPVQAYFEQRVTWASSCAPQVFRLDAPPAGVPLFPFQVGLYGTGANFAMRRSVAYELGGFDQAFGVGSPTKGGEDVDMFVNVVVAGHSLAFEPSALVWHRHRADVGALEHQAVGYGTGLTAWLTKVALDRRLLPLALRRVWAGLRRGRQLAAPADATADATIDTELREALAAVGKAERRAFLRGPRLYARARRAGARRRPLDQR